MAHRTSSSDPIVWRVVSVSRRSRDGPERLADAYRILLGQQGCRPRGGTPGLRGVPRTEEPHNGDGLVRSGVDRAPGTRTDH